MEWYEFFDIAERDLELLNPTSPDKVIEVGRMLGLAPGVRVVEFGSGYGEVLALWAEEYGITGVGVEVRAKAHERALRKIEQRGLADRITLHLGDGAAFAVEEHSFDVACCIGATFIWGDFAQALPPLRRAAKPTGRIAVGEPYWRTSQIPPAYAQHHATLLTETQILEACRAEQLELGGIVRGTEQDWDQYESANWHGVLAWLGENPDHPARDEMLAWLHQSQSERLGSAREFLGWAVYVLWPQSV